MIFQATREPSIQGMRRLDFYKSHTHLHTPLRRKTTMFIVISFTRPCFYSGVDNSKGCICIGYGPNVDIYYEMLEFVPQ
jgi:hypothetical protein